MDGDDLEGRQVQVSEASVLQVVEVPFCQGIPVPSIPAHHRAAHPCAQPQPTQTRYPQPTICCCSMAPSSTLLGRRRAQHE